MKHIEIIKTVEVLEGFLYSNPQCSEKLRSIAEEKLEKYLELL